MENGSTYKQSTYEIFTVFLYVGHINMYETLNNWYYTPGSSESDIIQHFDNDDDLFVSMYKKIQIC